MVGFMNDPVDVFRVEPTYDAKIDTKICSSDRGFSIATVLPFRS